MISRRSNRRRDIFGYPLVLWRKSLQSLRPMHVSSVDLQHLPFWAQCNENLMQTLSISKSLCFCEFCTELKVFCWVVLTWSKIFTPQSASTPIIHSTRQTLIKFLLSLQDLYISWQVVLRIYLGEIDSQTYDVKCRVNTVLLELSKFNRDVGCCLRQHSYISKESIFRVR